MTIHSALESLTDEQRVKIMDAFNELEGLVIVLEDEQFLAVHVEPNKAFETLEKSTYWLLGRFL